MAIVKNISARRREVRRSVPRPTRLAGMDRGQLAWAALYVGIFTLLGGLIAISGQSEPPFREGQVLSQSILARVAFQAPDASKTAEERRRAFDNEPAVYDFNEAYFTELEGQFDSLVQLAGDTSIRNTEDLPPQALTTLRQFLDADGKPTAQWRALVQEFLYGRPDDISKGLAGVPILSPERFEAEQRGVNVIRIRFKGLEDDRYRNRWVNLNDRVELEQRVRNLAIKFPRELQDAVVNIVMRDPKPTYIYNEAETNRRRHAAREAVPERTTDYNVSDEVIPAGTELQRQNIDLIRLEHEAWFKSLSTTEVVAMRTGQFGFVLLLGIAMWMYIASFNQRVMRNPMRGFAITALLLLCQAGAVGATQFSPTLLYGSATFPTLLAVTVLAIAYDQRFALAMGAVLVLLVMFSLSVSVGFGMMLLTGLAVALVQLGEVRTRSKLVKVGALTGIAMAAAAFIISLAERPVGLPGEWYRITIDALVVLVTALIVGMFVQGILPIIERVFRVTTAMTLRELNDASHPLLQRLAQSAPGTYQHSLRLADITEAAAEAIGANGLLCRVGAMYHDIGKMNKPMYFIENQGGGPNRHAKLSPAMSVLIIVGHVKDGIEMAREYGLPPVLRHFIESHHGTTLVEYFYNAARQQREAEDLPAPTEFEFRYPGPKPQTKEAAILMLGDGVESACRTLSDPTPARLEQLVHKMAQKRLMDGQFDECNLTLAELHKIEQAITKTLCAVYHGRIAYPSADRSTTPADQQQQQPQPVAAGDATQSPAPRAASS